MRKSRRWLLASMGASAALATGCASGSGKGSLEKKQVLPTPQDCEKLYAVPVPKLKDWLKPEPTTPADKEAALADAIEYGFGYNYVGLPAGLPKFKDKLLTHLQDAYRDAIADPAVHMSWKMSVAQAFILGQLTYYFWSQDMTKSLHFRHLASAWAVFGRATSSCWCAEWVIGAPAPPSRKAYVLPALPTFAGEVSIKQLDEPCTLC